MILHGKKMVDLPNSKNLLRVKVVVGDRSVLPKREKRKRIISQFSFDQGGGGTTENCILFEKLKTMIVRLKLIRFIK